MVFWSLSLLVWLTIFEGVASSVISIGQNEVGTNDTPAVKGLPPVELNEQVAANTVFAQPTNFQMNDQVIYVAYPVQSQESSRTLATLGLAGLPGLAGLTGLAAIPGLAAFLNNPNAMNQLNKPALDLATLMNSLFWPGSTGPATALGIQAASQFQPCLEVCTVNGVNNPLDDMRRACCDRCRGRFAINAAPLGICLRACSKRTREDCVGTCSSQAAGADQAACGVACQVLCPASVTPAPLLTDLTCCVIPPLVCGSKGSLDNQVQSCRRSCSTSLDSVPADVTVCHQACTSFPAESCRVDCDNGFGDAAKRANCAAACASLCGFTTEFVGYQIGLAPAGGRPYCPAPKLPVCMLGVGSSAAGLTRVAQQTNCMNRCASSTFTTASNRGVCIQACTLVTQGNCVGACSGAANQGGGGGAGGGGAGGGGAGGGGAGGNPTADTDICIVACNHLCPV